MRYPTLYYESTVTQSKYQLAIIYYTKLTTTDIAPCISLKSLFGALGTRIELHY